MLPQDNSLKRFVDKGLLQKTVIEKIEHPETKNLKFLSEHRMNDLILQVTQQCNLRCNYCAYSGNYYNRIHSEKKMNFSLAKKAIDFYLARSDEMSELCLSFYGGEPLLEFKFIMECVDYIKKHSGERTVRFPMTTNGTLLTEEKYDFLIKNNFKIIISLDGNKEAHDSNRKFRTGKGSFDVVMKKILLFPLDENIEWLIQNQLDNKEYKIEAVSSYYADKEKLKLLQKKTTVLCSENFEECLKKVNGVVFCENVKGYDYIGYEKRVKKALEHKRDIYILKLPF